MTESITKIRAVKQKHEKAWLAMEGVVAVGIGKTSDGCTGLIVSIKENASKFRQQIPVIIEEVPIEIQEIGEIKAL
ncbi:MAG: hypothetical protein ACE5HX_04790 [bacterium]